MADAGIIEIAVGRRVVVVDNDQDLYRIRFGEENIGGRIEIWRVLCRHWFPRFIPETAVVLDLGAGACEFINNIACAEKYAIDHNPDVERYAAKEVHCIVDDMIPGLEQLPESSVDRVLSSNVFEHLSDRKHLVDCLREIHRVLKVGGKIIVMQPNIRAVREQFYDFVDHRLPLTEKGMMEALSLSGFTVEYVKARFLPYTTKSRYPRWPILVRLYLWCPPLHHFMGGQMFVVASKK